MNSHYHQVHYGVFHAALPAALKGNSFKDFKDSVHTNRGNDFILGIWNRFRALNAEESSFTETQITKSDIEVSLNNSFSEGHLYLIKTPKTKEPLEAAYIAIAIANDKPIESLRYFTCEMPMQDGAGWVIGEVHGLGRRSNHGTIKELSFNAFNSSVILLLGWESSAIPQQTQSSPVGQQTYEDDLDGFIGQVDPVSSEHRQGQTKQEGPNFAPDLPGGVLAASGLRGPIRFVCIGNSVGLYSTQRGLRSRFVNRGAIIKIDDQQIRYFVSDLSDRDLVKDSKIDNRFGPLLNFHPQTTSNGTLSITASIENTKLAPRSKIDQGIHNSYSDIKPKSLPFFWNYQNRFSNWLAKSTFPVFYEVTGDSKRAYEDLIKTGKSLGQKGGCFYDRGERFIDQSNTRKGGGGVSLLIDTEPMSVGTFTSEHLQLNFEPLSFVFPTGYVHFLPEELVIMNFAGQYRAVPYSAVKYQIKTGIRIGIAVPEWTQPIGYVWQYMNKDGSPDRRYSNNLQIPQYQVWELDFAFGSGATLDTAFLDRDLLNAFVAVIDRLILLGKSRTTPRF